ncbi:N-acetylglucosamine-6-phosphate deacetylase [Oceanobacillus sp. HCA-5259]|uniref:N-acetylglucosamine-6-phosphate deacetylase n=1 Tax=Oceanobacillus sp. HCA-5259 TaxID=3134661 RepID=UPI0030C47BD2
MIVVKNAQVYTESEIIPEARVVIRDGLIEQIVAEDGLAEDIPPQAQVIDAKHEYLIPGFIDTHIHGAAGADVMDAMPDALQTMAEFLPKEGTTAFLATTITQATEKIEQALRNIANFKSKPGKSEVIGVHLEGPFIEKTKAGAQPVEYIQKPDMGLFNRWQELAGNKIKMITLAPEHDPEGNFIRYLNETGVTVSAGHTDAAFSELKRAVRQGVRQLTHLCNAMNGIHHRDIGAVGAALLLEELHAELIADGIHVSDEMLQLVYHNMGSGRLTLITDAMRAKGLPPGDYELGGQPVKVTEDRAVLADGTLAGSILSMQEAVKKMFKLLDGVGIRDIIQMASVNPAKQAGVYDRKGSITVGKDADLLIVDAELNIKYTICRGIIAHIG